MLRYRSLSELCTLLLYEQHNASEFHVHGIVWHVLVRSLLGRVFFGPLPSLRLPMVLKAVRLLRGWMRPYCSAPHWRTFGDSQVGFIQRCYLRVLDAQEKSSKLHCVIFQHDDCWPFLHSFRASPFRKRSRMIRRETTRQRRSIFFFPYAVSLTNHIDFEALQRIQIDWLQAIYYLWLKSANTSYMSFYIYKTHSP